jgi:transposase
MGFEHLTPCVSKTCRYYGIRRRCYYRWLERYHEEGEAGLRERSRGPKNSPRATKDDVVAKVIYQRQHYHFGPQKIAMYLARYHDVTISTSGVWRILKRLDMNRLPSSQRHNPTPSVGSATRSPSPATACRLT